VIVRKHTKVKHLRLFQLCADDCVSDQVLWWQWVVVATFSLSEWCVSLKKRHVRFVVLYTKLFYTLEQIKLSVCFLLEEIFTFPSSTKSTYHHYISYNSDHGCYFPLFYC
jgi:hypothetical protein